MVAGENIPTCIVSLYNLTLPSRDRTDPVGYKVSSIAFNAGSPVAASDSLTATTDIFMNPDNSKCPDECFRPVGLALDAKGRIFVSSDATGELYVLTKTGASTSTSTGTPTSPSAAATSTRPSAGQKLSVDSRKVLGAIFVVMLFL